ncbi:hypothetical protein V1478_012304 [Vespula squamosa]|uniref:Uncharacterized protein n=1 Tax=Vespula squamosa TaxID=30214 RepID=A0ABD2ACT1_VESSQ
MFSVYAGGTLPFRPASLSLLCAGHRNYRNNNDDDDDDDNDNGIDDDCNERTVIILSAEQNNSRKYFYSSSHRHLDNEVYNRMIIKKRRMESL